MALQPTFFLAVPVSFKGHLYQDERNNLNNFELFRATFPKT